MHDHGSAQRAMETEMNEMTLQDVASLARRESRSPQLTTIDTRPRPRAEPAARRLTIIGCMLLLAIVLAALGVRWFDVVAAAECHSSPVPLLFGATTDAVVTTGSGMACPVSVQTGSAAIQGLEIVSLPRNGAVVERGRTGVTYRAYRNFKGDDAFAFALRGRSDFGSGTAVVWVKVNVK